MKRVIKELDIELNKDFQTGVKSENEIEENIQIKMEDIFELINEEKYSVFLDSSLKNKYGRYSIIGACPYLVAEQRNGKLFLNEEVKEKSFEAWLKDFVNENKEENNSELPMISGGIGYFSYTYGQKLIGIPSRHDELTGIPEAIITFYDLYIIHDNVRNKIFASIGSECGKRKLDEIMNILHERQKKEWKTKSKNTLENKAIINADFKKNDYLKVVQKMIDYIVQGDIYIANMTQQLNVKSNKNPFEVFKYLRKNNPSPFGGYFQYGDFQIVSASPERFFKVENSVIETRPIKGTRKRGLNPVEDEMMKIELKNSEKDKSELLMIVDLERNDLNRVCVPGSVEVNELFAVEQYATVFHLVSTITGRLNDNTNIVNIIKSMFPGGSITGAPKYRAIEIIDELEHTNRGLYTGSIGYIGFDGNCDFNIVIRTALHKDGEYILGAGGGITCESELEFEYEETLQKAKAIVEAICN